MCKHWQVSSMLHTREIPKQIQSLRTIHVAQDIAEEANCISAVTKTPPRPQNSQGTRLISAVSAHNKFGIRKWHRPSYPTFPNTRTCERLYIKYNTPTTMPG